MLTEASLTEMAFVGLLLVVDVADVPLEVGGYREGSFTELAFIGLFSGVGPEVPGEVGGPGEGLAAVLAAVPLLVGLTEAVTIPAQHRLQCLLYWDVAARLGPELGRRRVSWVGVEGGG